MKKLIVLIVGIIIYRLLLDMIYVDQIVPFFSYWLMIDQSSFVSYVESWAFLAAMTFPVLFFYRREEEDYYATTMFVLFLYFIKLVPLTSFLFYQPQSFSFVIQQGIMWILLFVLLYVCKPITFKFIKKSEAFVTIVTIIVSLTVVWVSGKYASFRVHFSIDDVYDLRMEAREFNMPTLIKYLYSFSGNIIPICMIYYMSKKKMTMTFFLAFVGLLNFSIAGSKSTLFRILLCFSLLYIQKFDYKKWMMPSFLTISLLSIIEFKLLNLTNISSILIRRVFYIPNLLDSVYYDYFKNDEPYFFDTSKFTQLQFNIGGDIFGNDAMRCNNGFFTDAYVNLGIAGCFVYPFIFAVLIKILEGACIGHYKYIAVFSAFLFVTTLESTFFTTSLLTHGLFLMILTLYFMPVHDSKQVLYCNRHK